MTISDFLRSRRVPFQVLLHAPTVSASRLARCLHTPGGRVAKAVLVRAGERFVLAVLPATHRMDLEKLKAVLGRMDVGIATPEELEQVFADCEPGALPPFGRLYGLETIVDASLAGGEEIVFEGNTRYECVRMRYRDYEQVEAPIRARFASRISQHRRAG